MKERLIDKLKKAEGWSATKRYKYAIKDSNNELIQEVWLKPLSRADQKRCTELALSGDFESDYALTVICSNVYLDASSSEKAFTMSDVEILKGHVNVHFLEDILNAVLGKSKAYSNFVEEEKKD